MHLINSEDGFFVSLDKSLSEIDKNWGKYNGLLMTGTHAPEDIHFEGSLDLIKQAREKNIPTLGICFGLHLGAIEFARNVLKIPEANSTELDPKTKSPVIDKLPGMRVGLRPVMKRLENHWHQYKLNTEYLHLYGQEFHINMTRETDGDIAEQMTLAKHPFFVLTQYHPEYNSMSDKPHPLLIKFVQACKRTT